MAEGIISFLKEQFNDADAGKIMQNYEIYGLYDAVNKLKNESVPSITENTEESKIDTKALASSIKKDIKNINYVEPKNYNSEPVDVSSLYNMDFNDHLFQIDEKVEQNRNNNLNNLINSAEIADKEEDLNDNNPFQSTIIDGMKNDNKGVTVGKKNSINK